MKEKDQTSDQEETLGKDTPVLPSEAPACTLHTSPFHSLFPERSTSPSQASSLSLRTVPRVTSVSLASYFVETVATAPAEVISEDGKPDASCPASPPPFRNTVINFDNSKAGLQNVDKRKTEEIIAEISKGSNFYRNEERKLRQRQEYLNKLVEKAKKYPSWCRLNPNASNTLSQKVDEMEKSMEKERCLNNVFAHLDMDMFYAAVEEKKNPALRLLPVGVGSLSMLSTTNYVARQYGVRAGMPGFIGKKLCPELVVVPLDYKAYKEEAMTVREVAKLYDPHFEAFGWDELSMKLSPKCLAKWITNVPPTPTDDNQVQKNKKSHEGEKKESSPDEGKCRYGSLGSADSVALSSANAHSPSSSFTFPQQNCNWIRIEHFKAADRAMKECRREIFEKTQLTASVGIAPSPELAKIASNYQKPNGQYCLVLTSAKEIREYLRDKPVRTAQGIGKSTEFQLHGLDIRTLGDIYDARFLLAYLLPHKTFSFLFATSIGCTPCSSFWESRDRKSSVAAVEGRRSQKQQRKLFFGVESVEGRNAEGSNESEEEEATEEEDELDSRTRKSVGEESTFGVLSSRAQLADIAQSHLHKAWKYIDEHQFLVQQVVVKVKYHTYQVRYSSKSVYPPTDKEEVLLRVLDKLLSPLLPQYEKFRLLGVRLEKLTYNRRARQASISSEYKEELEGVSTEENKGIPSSASLDVLLSCGVQRTISDLLFSSKDENCMNANGKQENEPQKKKSYSPSDSRKRRRSLDILDCHKENKEKTKSSSFSSLVEGSLSRESEDEIVLISSSSSSSQESLSVEIQEMMKEGKTIQLKNEKKCEANTVFKKQEGDIVVTDPSTPFTESQFNSLDSSEEVVALDHPEVIED